MPPLSPLPVAVVGAGAAGLAAAHDLAASGRRVVVFEADGRAGGVVHSVEADGFTADLGPNTATYTPAIAGLVETLGLKGEVVFADAKAPRYVVRGGRTVPIPLSPPALLSSPLFSLLGKLRLLAEPLVPRRTADESLAGFIRRRFGVEVLDRAASAFVAGVWAGDPERLSAHHAFPRLVALEQAHGSVLRGMVHAGRTGAERPRSFSFRRGMQTLTDALASTLDPSLRLHTPVRSLYRDHDGWRVVTDTHPEGEAFSSVILAVPLDAVVALVPDLSPADRALLGGVAHPPVSVLALGFRREQVAHALDGFGVLVPEGEPFSLLGALFSSTLFPGRAPDGHALLTVFAGGTRRPDLAPVPATDLVAIVLADLDRLLGVRGVPVWTRHAFWPRAIPQYDVGYGAVLDALARIEQQNAGLLLAGSYRGGISLGDTLASGIAAADRILAPTVRASTSP